MTAPTAEVLNQLVITVANLVQVNERLAAAALEAPIPTMSGTTSGQQVKTETGALGSNLSQLVKVFQDAGQRLDAFRVKRKRM